MNARVLILAAQLTAVSLVDIAMCVFVELSSPRVAIIIIHRVILGCKRIKADLNTTLGAKRI